MSVEAKPRPRSRDIVERVISLPRQTASSLPSRVSLICAEEADGELLVAIARDQRFRRLVPPDVGGTESVRYTARQRHSSS
jgi:hypothetical protein